MAHSLEVRVPFVDHVLVERAFPLPDRVKAPGGRAKKLLRNALVDRLPQAHFRAPKRGFVGPTAVWLRNELRETVTDELSASRLDRLGFFDSAAVEGLLRDHLGGHHNRESALWALLSFSIWHRIYCEQPGAVAPSAAHDSVASVL
jgi:asparagine synthase (glutamine-hydrolysing)